MSYPFRTDYIDAVWNLRGAILSDELLKNGEPVKRDAHSLYYANGGRAIVFRVKLSDQTEAALRCWTEPPGNLLLRFQTIDNYLKNNPLPYFVGFSFQPKGIRIRLSGTTAMDYPIVRMEWIVGDTLGDYIAKHFKDSSKMRRLTQRFLEMVCAFHQKQISHGDLQHGNIMIRSCDESICVVDYDSVWVPGVTMAADEGQTNGLPEYQHPRRAEFESLNAKADYFSELVIYLSLLAVSESSQIWSDLSRQFKQSNGKLVVEQLLFSESDLKDPARSAMFKKLKESKNPTIKLLTNVLSAACRETNLSNLLPIENILPGKIFPGGLQPPFSKEHSPSEYFAQEANKLAQRHQQRTTPVDLSSFDIKEHFKEAQKNAQKKKLS